MGDGHQWPRPHLSVRWRSGSTPTAPGPDATGPDSSAVDPLELAAAQRAGAALLRSAIARLRHLAHPHGGWSDFWLEPGCSTSWVTAYTACALADAAEAPGVSGGQRAEADELVTSAADRLLATHRDGAWGWSEGMGTDADSTAWAVRALQAAGSPVPAGSHEFLVRHLRPDGAATYRDHATGAWTAPMPEVTAVVLSVLAARGLVDESDLAQRWQALIDSGGVAVPEASDDGPEWRSHWWPDAAHPTALVLDALHRSGRGVTAPVQRAQGGAPSEDRSGSPEPPGQTPELQPPTGRCALADALWIDALRGRPSRRIADALVAGQLPGGGWAGDAVLLVPAQNGERPAVRTSDARGVFTTATVLHAAVALMHVLTELDPLTAHAGVARGTARPVVHDQSASPRSTRDERWDGVISRAAQAGGVPPERALEVFRSLTRESLAVGSPWPSPQLSSLASGSPVELSVGPAPSLRLTCEVGDPRQAPPGRLRSGLLAVERTARLLGMGEAWAGRRANLLEVLADSELAVPEGCRFWLWAGVDLPPEGPPVLKAYLSLHAGDVDDWRSRLHEALRALPPGGSVWPALACLRGAGWCHEVGIGELPGGHWGLKVYFELDRWRPDLVAELLTTADLEGSMADLTPDIPGVIRAVHRGRRRAGIALRVDPVTGDVTELTTTVALPPPLVGRRELAKRVADWLESRGQDASPLRATVAAVEPEWADAAPMERMLGLVTQSAGRGAPGVAVYVRPRPVRAVHPRTAPPEPHGS